MQNKHNALTQLQTWVLQVSVSSPGGPPPLVGCAASSPAPSGLQLDMRHSFDSGSLRGEQEQEQEDAVSQLARGQQHGDAPHAAAWHAPRPPFSRASALARSFPAGLHPPLEEFERRRRMPSNIASVGTLLDTLPQSASYRSPHASRSDFSRSLDHDPSHGPLAFDLTERSSVYERRPSGLYDRSSGLYKIPGVFRQGSVGDTLPTWGSVNKPRQRNISVGALPSFDAFDGRAAVGSTGLPPSHVDDPLGAPSLGRAMLHAEHLLPHLPHR